MNIILFGYTGLGSSVLKGLLKLPQVFVSSVHTKKYDLPYPYYTEKQVLDICSENGIACYTELNVNKNEIKERLIKENPDLIIVASFGTILSDDILGIPKYGVINFHPSLLPAYRGPYPDQAVILNGEKTTGVSVHYVTENLDSGNILYQTVIEISDEDNFSSLKKKLSDTCERIVPEIIEMFKDGIIPEGIAQDESKSSYFKKPSDGDCMLNNLKDPVMLINKIRALNPFPGTYFLLNGKKVYIDSYELIQTADVKISFDESENHIDLIIDSCGIRLFKKK